MMSASAFDLERKKLDDEWARLRDGCSQLEQDKKQLHRELQELGIEYKLFVGNLSETSNEPEVRALFEKYGNLKEIHILRDKEGNHKRSCFVKFYTRAAAEKAIEGLDHKYTDTNEQGPLVVRYAHTKSSSLLMKTASALPTLSLLGAGGAHNIQPELLASLPGVGIAPVNMRVAQPSLSPSMGGVHPPPGIASPPMTLSRPALVQPRGPVGANLYVNNIGRMSETELRALFQEFGTILSCRTFPDGGYGFVSFDSTSSSQAAIAARNGQLLPDGSRRLEVALKKDKTGAPPQVPGNPMSPGAVAYQTGAGSMAGLANLAGLGLGALSMGGMTLGTVPGMAMTQQQQQIAYATSAINSPPMSAIDFRYAGGYF